MAFSAKTDWLGLETKYSSSLKLRSNGQNASNQVLQVPGSDGSILGDHLYGSVWSPNCEYAIVGAASISGLNLGEAYCSTSTKYAISKIHVATGAGTEPTVTADGVQLEPSASRAICVYPMDTINISPARHALTFGAFSYTESTDLTLQQAEFDAEANIAPATINGDPVATDATAGMETVTATFWTNSDTSSPTVSVASDWHITSDWNCVGADAQMFVWNATFTKYLSASQTT